MLAKMSTDLNIFGAWQGILRAVWGLGEHKKMASRDERAAVRRNEVKG